jgi:alpha-1,6-mannosyltransferase
VPPRSLRAGLDPCRFDPCRFDPCRFDPSAFGGELAVDVPPIRQDTPALYGPVFLSPIGAVTGVTGHQVWPGLIGMRLLALAPLVPGAIVGVSAALLAVGVPRMTRQVPWPVRKQ